MSSRIYLEQFGLFSFSTFKKSSLNFLQYQNSLTRLFSVFQESILASCFWCKLQSWCAWAFHLFMKKSQLKIKQFNWIIYSIEWILDASTYKRLHQRHSFNCVEMNEQLAMKRMNSRYHILIWSFSVDSLHQPPEAQNITHVCWRSLPTWIYPTAPAPFQGLMVILSANKIIKVDENLRPQVNHHSSATCHLFISQNF
jgi:hypothetical protein